MYIFDEDESLMATKIEDGMMLAVMNAIRSNTEVTSVNINRIPQPMPVSRKEPVRIFFGSNLSANGPKIIAPKDIPIYMTEMA